MLTHLKLLVICRTPESEESIVGYKRGVLPCLWSQSRRHQKSKTGISRIHYHLQSWRLWPVDWFCRILLHRTAPRVHWVYQGSPSGTSLSFQSPLLFPVKSQNVIHCQTLSSSLGENLNFSRIKKKTIRQLERNLVQLINSLYLLCKRLIWMNEQPIFWQSNSKFPDFMVLSQESVTRKVLLLTVD